MTSAAGPATDADRDKGATLTLPLVSVIVVNYNYGRFLRAAVESVLAQTYPRIECVVVDNASTDDSRAIIDELKSLTPSLKAVRRAFNDGQTQASLDGLAASSGSYVVFVDADDFLLPNCVEAHILAHLSLRTHVGFTSVEMFQIVDDEVVVGSGEEFARFVRRRRPCRGLVRPLDLDALGWDGRRTDLIEKLYYVPPLNVRWVWSPTSGNCYRRDALLLFADNPGLAHLFSGTDMYFAHAVGALCGSALIDEPLFAYRIHSDNVYTRRAQLDRTLAFKPGSQGDSNAKARRLIIDHLVQETARFVPNFWLRLNFVALAIRLDCPDEPGSKRARQSRLARHLNVARSESRRALGRGLYLFLMLASGVPIWTAIRNWRTLRSLD